ncbi:hypothetical protein L2E82_01439 [Cichorium intybus]|uniref:Uncharacterized protein n=1 Tax=Cichorium intybus TaxID=13427 RepID=A0ACB9H057_CICIN|nr:hypothetical protein L2E82_01439 [Cichorium intybus]
MSLTTTAFSHHHLHFDIHIAPPTFFKWLLKNNHLLDLAWKGSNMLQSLISSTYLKSDNFSTHQASKMALLSSLKQIVGIESCLLSKELMSEFFKLVLGTLSLPINLPNINYYRCLQARKNIVRMLGELIDERRRSHETH